MCCTRSLMLLAAVGLPLVSARSVAAAPKPGDTAPLFKLKHLDGTTEVDLGRFSGDRPVLLLFGSYT